MEVLRQDVRTTACRVEYTDLLIEKVVLISSIFVLLFLVFDKLVNLIRVCLLIRVRNRWNRLVRVVGISVYLVDVSFVYVIRDRLSRRCRPLSVCS